VGGVEDEVVDNILGDHGSDSCYPLCDRFIYFVGVWRTGVFSYECGILGCSNVRVDCRIIVTNVVLSLLVL
jgi:hypothetical protein